MKQIADVSVSQKEIKRDAPIVQLPKDGSCLQISIKQIKQRNDILLFHLILSYPYGEETMVIDADCSSIHGHRGVSISVLSCYNYDKIKLVSCTISRI